MWSGFLALAALSSITLARIEGISAPKTIVANQDFEVTLITGNYIQSVKDLVAAFALTPRVDHGGFIGSEYLGSFFLGPEKSNILTNITFTVKAPISNSSTYLSGIVTSLYGASNGATTIQWNLPVTFGDEVSSESVSSFEGTSVCSTATSSDPPTPPTSAPAPDTAHPNANCFPTATQTLIQSSLVYANALIDSVLRNDTQSGRQNRGELNGYLGDASAATGGGRQAESCGNPAPPAWPPLSEADSQIRAISILRDAQSGLNALSGAVLECDDELAKRVVCRVLSLADNLDDYPPFK